MPINPNSGYRPIADKNVVYNDYVAGTTISQNLFLKKLFSGRQPGADKMETNPGHTHHCGV
jgi:hypothetical protein